MLHHTEFRCTLSDRVEELQCLRRETGRPTVDLEGLSRDGTLRRRATPAITSPRPTRSMEIEQGRTGVTLVLVLVLEMEHFNKILYS